MARNLAFDISYCGRHLSVSLICDFLAINAHRLNTLGPYAP